MKWKLFFLLLFFSSQVNAEKSSSMVLRAVIPTSISLSVEEERIVKNQSIISLFSKSNVLQLENAHNVEIENPLNLKIETQIKNLDEYHTKKEYRIIVDHQSINNHINPFFKVKISAN